MSRYYSRITSWAWLPIGLLIGGSLAAPFWWQNSPLPLPQTTPENVTARPRHTLPQRLAKSTPQVVRQDHVPLESPTLLPIARDDNAPELHASPIELSQFSAPRQLAPVSPPVAERIDIDPSVAETPAIPTTDVVAEIPTTPHDSSRQDVDNTARETQAEPETQKEPVHRSPLLRHDIVLPKTTWPYPVTLLEMVKTLGGHKSSQAWAATVLQEFDHLKGIDTLAAAEAGESLRRLTQLAQEAKRISNATTDQVAAARLLHASYAITRRVAIWQEVHSLVTQPATPVSLTDPHGIQQSLVEVDARVRQLSHAGAWRDYLLLDKALALVNAEQGIAAGEFRELARKILIRLDAPALSEKQFSFFRDPPFPKFELELRRLVNEPVDYQHLLRELEAYETMQLSHEAHRVTEIYQTLRWSLDPRVAKLAETMNAHYRNANVRVAISSEMINRMLPAPEPVNEERQENLLGADVYSNSTAWSRLRVVLLPDRLQWRLGLLADGEAVSDAEAHKSGAVFFNEGWANFRARKLLEVDRRGVKVGRADAAANVQTDLRGFETHLDGVPLLNMLARSIAQKQYEEQSAVAQAEMENRVAYRASSRFDNEIHVALEKAEQEFQKKLIRPLQKIGLQPTPVDMETTETRLIVRERLAGNEQLSAHTPRPQAPGDSWLSVQVHESAFNNALEHLGLNGKRTDIRTLYRELTDRFDQPNATIPDDLPDDVVVHFAPEDAVRVTCKDGRVMLTVRLLELSQGRDVKWKNFIVRAYYKPFDNQDEANLVRDGVIELAGERLGFGDQVKLRGIFSKVLARNKNISIINKQLSENPKLLDMHVNQFVISDGWIGVAISPNARATARISDKSSVK